MTACRLSPGAESEAAPVAVCGLVTVVAARIAEDGLQGMWPQ